MEPSITLSQWFQAAADDDCVILQTNLNDFQRSLDESGETALMISVRVGNLAAAHILAEAESKIAMPSGHTALMLAAGSNNTELCRLLAPLESGITTDAGINALMVAADTGSADALRVLLDYIGDDTDYEEHTALFYAASSGHIECANILSRAFPPTKKELVSCIDMATTQGDAQMLDFLNGLLQEIVGADSINDVIREYRNAAVLERSSSRGVESASIDHVVYDDTRSNDAYGSASSDDNQHGCTDSMRPYSIYASPQPDTTWDHDSKNDLVVSDTSVDMRTIPATEINDDNQQQAASIFNSRSPLRRDVSHKEDEITSLRSQLHTATYEIQRLQNLLKEHTSYSWDNKPSDPDGPAIIPIAPDLDMRRLQDKCASLELQVSTLELRNKQLRTSLDDLDQSQSSKVFNETPGVGDVTITEELTVNQILDFLYNNKESAEQVYKDLKHNMNTLEQASTERSLSTVPVNVDAQFDDVDDECNNPDGSRSSSIEMVEMRSPTPGCNTVPGLEERLETENMTLQAEIDVLTRQMATKDEQIKTLRQELYDLRQAQLKMSMTMGPSMDSVRPPSSLNKYDFSETNHEIEVDMTISNTSFSCPESHCGTKGDSAGSNQVTSEGREYMMSFDTNNEERGGRGILAAKLPPLPGTRSGEFEEINASVVQIKLNKIQLELQEALDDKRVILEQLEEERNEKSQLASELNVCRDTIDHMTSEIEDLRDKLDESLAKESTLSNDIMELRGRMNPSPRPGECGSPVSVLAFNDNNQQPSPKMDDIYDIIRGSNSYQELLTRLNFNSNEINDILARQNTSTKDYQPNSNSNKNLVHEISTINLKTGATSNLSPDVDVDQELTRLQDSNNELEKKCADLQSSNVVLSAEAKKLVTEVIGLRDMLKEQEKRYSDLLLEKNMLESRSVSTNKANLDSLYEQQPEQRERTDIATNHNVQSRGPTPRAPLSTQSTRPASLRGESDSHGYTPGGNHDNRATSYSGSVTDERCKRISSRRGSNTRLEKGDSSKRRNPFDMRDVALMDEEESYLITLQDERDRRMTTQDLEPFSSIMSGTTSTTITLSFNLIDGVYANVTPLMQAVLDDDIDSVDNNLMYVRKVRSDGVTALMLAAYLDRVQIAEKLGPLESNIRGPESLTALEIALYRENYATAAVLRPIEGIDTSNGIRVTTKRHTDLMTAVTENNPLSVWCLIPLQGRVQDWSGKTALMYAIEQKKTFCARILATAETRLQDRNGFTALMYAVMAGNNNMVNLLVEEEAGFVGRWHERLPSKFTALILACYYGRLKAATILAPFESGIKDSVGRTPKYYAQNCNSRVPISVKASLIDLFNGHRGQ